jgi:uncharacterized protein YneF (UPF0154 family)
MIKSLKTIFIILGVLISSLFLLDYFLFNIEGWIVDRYIKSEIKKNEITSEQMVSTIINGEDCLKVIYIKGYSDNHSQSQIYKNVKEDLNTERCINLLVFNYINDKGEIVESHRVNNLITHETKVSFGSPDVIIGNSCGNHYIERLREHYAKVIYNKKENCPFYINKVFDIALDA